MRVHTTLRHFLLITAAALVLTGPLPAAAQDDAVSSFRRGTGHFREGRFDEALRHFEEAAERDSSSPEIQRGIAHTLASLGQRELRAGNLQAARDYLERAVDTLSEEASFHLLLAVVFIRLGDLYLARGAAEEALERSDDHPQALEILGDILYQEGSIGRALRKWETALEQPGAPASRLRGKIARAEKEWDAEGAFDEDVSVHFTMQYDGPVPGDMARAILDRMEEAYEMLGEELGHYPRGDIPVILYSKVLFSEITKSPMWVAGTFDGKIRVPVGGLTGEHDIVRLNSILTHELTHAFLRSMVPRRLPLWFEEGLAKHFEGIPTERASSFIERMSATPPVTFTALNLGLRGHGASVEISYLSAMLAVRYLIEEEGFWTVRQILETVGEGQSFEKAFLDETRMEVGEFEEKWSSSHP